MWKKTILPPAKWVRRPYLTKRGALAGFALDWNKTGMLRERKKSTFQFGPSVFNVQDMHARPPRSIDHKTHPKPKGRARTMRARRDSSAVARATLDTRVLGAPPQWPPFANTQFPSPPEDRVSPTRSSGVATRCVPARGA